MVGSGVRLPVRLREEMDELCIVLLTERSRRQEIFKNRVFGAKSLVQSFMNR